MSITTAAAFHSRDMFVLFGRAMETCFSALSQSWLDASHSRQGPLPPEQHDADEDLRLMVALTCAALH